MFSCHPKADSYKCTPSVCVCVCVCALFVLTGTLQEEGKADQEKKYSFSYKSHTSFFFLFLNLSFFLNLSSCSFFFFLTLSFFTFWPYHAAHGVLVPRPGIKPTPPAVEGWNLNHCTSREVLIFLITPVPHLLSFQSWGLSSGQGHLCSFTQRTQDFLRS